MVAETEIQISGWCSRTHAVSVPLPTAVGPASTVSRDGLPDGLPDGLSEEVDRFWATGYSGANSLTSATTCLAPSPRTRRVSEILSFSIT